MRLGILGGGQLGRMLAVAALEMGLTPCLLDPDPGSCGLAAGQGWVVDYTDVGGLEAFARAVDVCTFEFENIPLEAARTVADLCPLFPSARALEVSQDRWVEKEFLRSLKIEMTDYVALEPGEPVPSGGILKTRRLGYDGKGQGEDWQAVGHQPALWERRVPFERELSQLAVRSRQGEIEFYPLVETIQQQGILSQALAPARQLPAGVEGRAQQWVRQIMEELDYVGVLALEMFLCQGQLLANEMAPRVHNSGHWTDRGSLTSQFHNHVRAVVGWPLGNTRVLGHSRLINLLGEIPSPRRYPAGVSMQLYGKAPRAGRKLGHITLQADSEKAVDALQEEVWASR